MIDEENKILRAHVKDADTVIGMASTYLKHIMAGDSDSSAAGVLLDLIDSYHKTYVKNERH